MNGIIYLIMLQMQKLNIFKNRLRCHLTNVWTVLLWILFRSKFAFSIISGDKLERDNIFCLLFTFHLNLNDELTTASLNGGWVPETSKSFHYWQPAPRWRLLPWLVNPGNPAMSPHTGKRHRHPSKSTRKSNACTYAKKKTTRECWCSLLLTPSNCI